jgi:hypothetical protein
VSALHETVLGGCEGGRLDVRDLLIVRNPDPESSLPYLLRLPLGEGMFFRAGDTWPRTKAVFCYPVTAEEWPLDPEIVEQVPIRSCVRRGAAIDLVLDRGRENRSQIVFTRARGREMVFWQSPKTRKQSRPNVRTPTARAAGLGRLDIIVDTREQYAYRFAKQQVSLEKRALPCGDYGVVHEGRLLAAVERKSLADLVSSLLNGKLRFALGELSALPRAAVVVEDRYARIFDLEHARPAVVADGIAELQVLTPTVPIVFCDSRPLAEEWTYRYLAAAATWADSEENAAARVSGSADATREAPAAPTPSTKELRAWARSAGLEVPDRGRLRPEVLIAWREAQLTGE